MSEGRIMVGYGSDRREGSTKKGLYGKRSGGKRRENGGFGEPTVDFTRISQEKWDSIFDSPSPFWEKHQDQT